MPKKFPERVLIRGLPQGTIARVDAVLEEGESRAAFIRRAVDEGLRRNERRKRMEKAKDREKGGTHDG